MKMTKLILNTILISFLANLASGDIVDYYLPGWTIDD